MTNRKDGKDKQRRNLVSLESSKRLENNLEGEDRQVAGRGHSELEKSGKVLGEFGGV